MKIRRLLFVLLLASLCFLSLSEPVLAEGGVYKVTSVKKPTTFMVPSACKGKFDGFVDVSYSPQNSDNYLKSMDKKPAPFYYGRMPLLVYTAPGRGVRGWNPGMNDLIQDALGQWEKALNGKVCFVPTSDPSQADISFIWVHHIRDRDDAEGITRSYNKQGYAISASIEVETMDRFTGEVREMPQVRAILIHELGHALGLGHSPNRRDIMYSTDVGQRNLTQRDVNTIRAIYP